MDKALLKLFSGVRVNDVQEHAMPDEILERTVRNGYVLSPLIPLSDSLLDTIESVVGLSGEKLNASFHKSWLVIQEASIEQLVIQQILHYFTTYGFESLGIYNEQIVHIPNEVLELPKSVDRIPLVVIRAINDTEIVEEIIKLGSGIALASDTLWDIMTIVEKGKYDSKFVVHIKNRELKSALNDLYGIVPAEPEAFLRHVISKLTDETLLIKNDYMIEKIKGSSGKFLDELLKDAPDDLASIFFRFKPLFLAMKSISRNKTFFNRLRKKANKLHKPLPPDYMNSVTTQLKQGNFDEKEFEKRLKKASVFRKIRLAYALQFRKESPDSIVYQVRNGKGWATDFAWIGGDVDLVLNLTLDSIAKNITVKGKVLFIPNGIHYALPATEKQFTGNFPTGTYITVPNDLIVGVHWADTEKRVDLDLSLVSANTKIGWDASYRNQNVLFSGDMTAAPNGASELFYLKQANENPYALMLNYYNFSKQDEVEAKIVVANEKPDVFKENYMLDPNNLIATARINVVRKQNLLGLVINVNGENRIYFSHTSVGNLITARNNEILAHSRNYLIAKSLNPIDFNDLLVRSGALIVSKRPEEGGYIDLSPEALTKTIFLDLLMK